MILQALKGYYDRVAGYEESKIAPRGFSYEKVSFAAILGDDGSVIDVNDLRTREGRLPRPLSLMVPQPPKRSGKKPPPAFLWDKTGYVFGMESCEDEDNPFAQNVPYREAFLDFHRKLLKDTDDPGLKVFLRFLENWKPEQFATLRCADEMIDTNIVFRVGNECCYLHERDAASDIWAKAGADSKSAAATCLVTGESLSIARLHPSIKGVKLGRKGGGSIVSFNKKSFVSHGKSQGDNAPVSEAAVFAYTTALNDLLRDDGPQNVQIGDATVAYWAEAADPKEAEAAESVFGWLSDPRPLDQADASATARLRQDVMERIEKGRPLADPELHWAEDTKFYILGLSPNAARLSVRFWEATTLGALGRAFHDHFQDLRIEPKPWKTQPAIWRLLSRTAPARKNQQGVVTYDTKSIQPNLSGEMMRAILGGRRYPGSLLATLVMRVRSDGYLDGIRTALIKATIVRTMRLENRLPVRPDGTPQEEYLMRTDSDDPNIPRRLGRLFAVLERAQAAALGDKVNATIKDKFLGAAAATPSRVFPGLIINATHHTARLRKGHSDATWVKKPAATGFAIERDIARLMSCFSDGFPSQNSIEEQGLFLIGYYQERFGGKPDEAIGVEPGIDTALDDEADHHDGE